MPGQLRQGKRLHGRFFLEHVLEHGNRELRNYLLAVDVDMNTVSGYAISSWERGYGDMFCAMDLATLRRTPGPPGIRDDPERPQPGSTAGATSCSRRVPSSSGPVGAAEADGFAAYAGTELEFILFEDSYESAWDRRYVGLTGANR